MLQDFKKFALKGNVVDLAVGVVIGAAFGKIVTSLVTDIITPMIGIILNGINITDLAFTIGMATIRYGAFLQSIIDFLIISLSIYIAIKQIVRIRKALGLEEEASPITTKECPACFTKIPLKATRCPHRTSAL